MNDYFIDVKKVNELGSDVMLLATDIGNIMLDTFTAMEDLYSKGYWKGVSADNFSQFLKQEKKDYLNFKNSLYRCGKDIVEYSNDINNLIMENRK